MTPAEVIVKFTEKSRLGTIINESRDRPLGENRALLDGVADLSEALSTPLIAKSITSGSELVLGVNVTAVLADLRKKLEGYPGVSKVRKIPSDQKPILPQISEEVAVGFLPDTEESKTLAQARTCQNPADCIEPVVANLAEKTGYPLKGRLLRGRRLAVGIDLGATIQNLVERLKKNSDVEYAQPNFILGPMSSGMAE
ncbi:MAG: hypothetical protein ABFS02_05485 [Pseudomonadota bacterium]